MTLPIIILLPLLAGVAGTLLLQRRGFSTAAWVAVVPNTKETMKKTGMRYFMPGPGT
ncbi:MAG: hypothetical protein NTNFB02_14500 [Nitrospira sp.]